MRREPVHRIRRRIGISQKGCWIVLPKLQVDLLLEKEKNNSEIVDRFSTAMAAAMEKSSDHLHVHAVSDSDDDRPYQEPEFVVHIMDDHSPPAPAPAPPPRRQMQQRPGVFPPQPQALFVAARDVKLQKECSAYIAVRVSTY
jgi:hypothetical protein